MLFSEVDSYLHKVTPNRNRVLAAMESYARKNRFPIIGPLAGRVLYQAALMTGAKKILELGSGYGYSAFWFSLAMGKAGSIILTDSFEPNKARAIDYFRQGGLKSKFDFRVGDAMEIASGIRGKFDIILNDIDKQDYPKTIDLAARLLKPGGVFITDNIIWSGRVMDPTDKRSTTKGIRAFTKRLYGDNRFFTTILPLRDGLAVALKK